MEEEKTLADFVKEGFKFVIDLPNGNEVYGRGYSRLLYNPEKDKVVHGPFEGATKASV